MSTTALSPLPSTLPAPTRARGWPLLGALPGMLTDAPGTMLRAMRANPGQLFSIQLGPVRVPVVTQPEHLQQVLIDDAKSYTKAGMWSVTKPLLGEGLVTSDGDVWRRQRQLMQPLFTPRYLHSMSGLMVEAIDAQLQRLAARADAPVEVGNEMTLVTQRVLMETMFGGSLDLERSNALAGHLNAAFQAMNMRLFLYFLPSWVPLPGDRTFHGAIAEIDRAMLSLVAERRARPVERADMLTLLIEARDPDTGAALSDREIRDQLVTLFVAGLDTTAVTLTWLTHLLQTHPEVDEALRAEVATVVGERLPTGEDLPKLGYTKAVIQEAMRVYPPAWIFPRYTATGAEVGGRWIAPGSSMLISPWLTHRDGTHWERPDTFDPSRFQGGAPKGVPRLSYIPIGAGGRMCIGAHFAMMEAQLATVMLVQRFRPRPVSDRPVVAAAASTLKPKGGLWMRMARA